MNRHNRMSYSPIHPSIHLSMTLSQEPLLQECIFSHELRQAYNTVLRIKDRDTEIDRERETDSM